MSHLWSKEDEGTYRTMGAWWSPSPPSSLDVKTPCNIWYPREGEQYDLAICRTTTLWQASIKRLDIASRMMIRTQPQVWTRVCPPEIILFVIMWREPHLELFGSVDGLGREAAPARLPDPRYLLFVFYPERITHIHKEASKNTNKRKKYTNARILRSKEEKERKKERRRRRRRRRRRIQEQRSNVRSILRFFLRILCSVFASWWRKAPPHQAPFDPFPASWEDPSLPLSPSSYGFCSLPSYSSSHRGSFSFTRYFIFRFLLFSFLLIYVSIMRFSQETLEMVLIAF